MKIQVLISVIFAFVVLSACSTEPRYKTEYTLTPPSSSQGRTCVATCQGNKQLCITNARLATQQCQADNRQGKLDCYDQAKASYRSCLRNIGSHTSAQHQQIRRSGCASTRSSAKSQCNLNFGYRTCNANSSCDREYRGCFKLCGGTVKSQRVCYQNCGKAR